MELKCQLNGEILTLDPSPVTNGKSVLVPLHAFCAAVGAEAKHVDGGPLAVCRDDLCIPLEGSGETLTQNIGDVLYAPLEAFGGPLGLTWSVSGSLLSVDADARSEVGLGVGDSPPAFTLPDLYSGEPVSVADYRGRKTVFYMWASW